VDYSRAVGTAGGLGRHRQQPIGRLHRAAHVAAAATDRAGRAPLHLVGVARSSYRHPRRHRAGSGHVPVADGIALIAAYQFFYQRSDSLALTPAGTAIATDADQNRLWIGVQFGYPIKFE